MPILWIFHRSLSCHLMDSPLDQATSPSAPGSSGLLHILRLTDFHGRQSALHAQPMLTRIKATANASLELVEVHVVETDIERRG
jgi:hypothetical protein